MRWYTGRVSGCQGLIIDAETGANIAVSYDKKDGPLIAAAPVMRKALEGIALWLECPDFGPETIKQMRRSAEDAVREAGGPEDAARAKCQYCDDSVPEEYAEEHWQKCGDCGHWLCPDHSPVAYRGVDLCHICHKAAEEDGE